jgi:hypothetical protein
MENVLQVIDDLVDMPPGDTCAAPPAAGAS